MIKVNGANVHGDALPLFVGVGMSRPDVSYTSVSPQALGNGGEERRVKTEEEEGMMERI